MTRPLAVSTGIALALAAASPRGALADEPAPPPDPQGAVIATDPAPPPPPPDPGTVIATDPQPVDPVPVPEPVPEPVYDPYLMQPIDDPVAPPRESPGESTIVYGAASQLNVSGDRGLAAAGWGGTIGFGWLQRHGDQPTGFDVAGTFLTGKDVSIYDLSFRLIASPKIGTHALVPYVAFGFCTGASRIITDFDRMSNRHVDFGLGIGPSASAGVHGFVGKSMYWRAGAGFLGAGVGAVTADLAIGMVVD